MRRIVDADKLIEKMKIMAGCETCENYGGVKCRACNWDDAIRSVDDFADVPDGYWVVSYFDSKDSEATVTVFDNEENAVKCHEAFCKLHDHVAIDKCQIYSQFYSS